MAKRFYSGYDAAEYAATITDKWQSETGELIDTKELLAMMGTADEEAQIDEESKESYYIVDDNGALGATNNAEKMIIWIAKPLTNNTNFYAGIGQPTQYVANTAPPKSMVRPHGNIGYSYVIDSPRFLEEVRKNKRTGIGCAFMFIFAPFLIMTLYTLISGELEVIYGMFIGGAISAVFFIIYFLASLKDKFQKPWEGIVEKKYEKKVRRHNKKTATTDYYDEPHGIIIVRDDKGKTHKINERLDTDMATSYTYLQLGERVRFHARMGLLYPYEKYDKSKDEYVICAFCCRRTSIVENECERCHRPILK